MPKKACDIAVLQLLSLSSSGCPWWPADGSKAQWNSLETGLIIRRWRRQPEATGFGNPTTSASRKRVSALPSEPLPVRGAGRHRWRLEVMRIRAAESFEVEVNACDATGHMTSIEERRDPWRAAI